MRTEDGCAVELYRRLRPHGEPELIHRVAGPGASILELGAGAGRLTHALIALGYRVVAVDTSPEMLASITGARCVLANIRGLVLDERFDAVLLASCLINVPDAEERAAFLASCRRHVAARGVVLIERHSPQALLTAVDGPIGDEDGIAFSLRDVRVHRRTFSGTLVAQTSGDEWTQTFSAYAHEDVELSRELELAGLVFDRWLNDRETWLSARRR